jgi:hypothetical protein
MLSIFAHFRGEGLAAGSQCRWFMFMLHKLLREDPFRVWYLAHYVSILGSPQQSVKANISSLTGMFPSAQAWTMEWQYKMAYLRELGR